MDETEAHIPNVYEEVIIGVQGANFCYVKEMITEVKKHQKLKRLVDSKKWS